MKKLLTAFAVLVATVVLGPAGIARAQTPSVCTGTITITSLAFVPSSIAAGGTSAATLAARNCTTVRQQVTSQWVARFASPAGPGIPPGCPAVDPLSLSLDFPPGGSLTRSVSYLVFQGCTATVLHLTVTISKNGEVLASRSADLQITH